MIGETINGYKIIRNIGEGGMGEVYYAESSNGQKSAVKVLREEYRDNHDLVKRFKVEIKSMVKLQGHPNIIELKSTTISGDPVIIMEYLEGEDLFSLIKRTKKPIEESMLIEWSKQILSAIKYAHENEIIHRDIKPSNIFLTKFGNIKILDFGIAKVLQETEGGDVDDTLIESLTKTRASLGAPQFMSPEQSFDPKMVSYPSDIYSFGKTLNYLATGGGNPMIKPSEKLSNVIAKCTKECLEDRYKTVDEVIANLIPQIAFTNDDFIAMRSPQHVVIPPKFTSIAAKAFFDCKNIKSIDIPNTITSIGEEAFAECENLTSIIIPDSVHEIGVGAFKYCYRLKYIEIPDSVTLINERLFQSCVELTSIIIPNSVTKIEFEAFECCTSLESITIPSCVTHIGALAFCRCYKLRDVILNSPIETIEIGSNAFTYSSVRIILPEKCTS